MRSSLTPLLALPFLLSLSACQSWWPSDKHASAESMSIENAASQPATVETTVLATVASPLVGWDAYGAPIVSAARLTDAKGFAQVAMNPEAFDGKTMRIVGIVEEVCQTKGCWMTFRDGGQTMRIKFADYGFFMPKDASGREAIIDGVFSIEMTPAAEARHYLEDAGRADEAEAITGDVETLTFMADSVLLMQD